MKNKLKNIKKRYWIAAAIAVLLILFFAFNSNGSNEVVTYEVQRQDVTDTITLAGTIDVDNRVELGFATAGRVSNIYIEEGESVRKGQVIAQIDQNQVQASLIQAQANQAVTRADTQSDTSLVSVDLEAVKRQQNTLVETAYRSYLTGDLQAYLVGTSNYSDLESPTISGTYLSTQSGEYLLDVYSSSTKSGYSYRLRGLGEGVHSAQTNAPGKLGDDGLYIQFDADANYDDTSWVVPIPNTRSSSYVTRKNAYENALATREQAITQAENSLKRVTASAGEISRTEAQLQQARAQVSAVYAQLNDGKIIAPFSGVIAKNTLEVGQIVSAYEGVVTLFGSEQRQLGLNVPEIYINKLQEGDTVEVVLDAYPNEVFSGTVTSIDIIDTIVDGVPVYETVVEINEQDSRIRVGMNAKGNISSEQKLDVIAVPQHYLISSGDTTTVLKQVGTEVVATEVQIGFKGNNGLVEITSGLEEGDTIVRPDEQR